MLSPNTLRQFIRVQFESEEEARVALQSAKKQFAVSWQIACNDFSRCDGATVLFQKRDSLLIDLAVESFLKEQPGASPSADVEHVV